MLHGNPNAKLEGGGDYEGMTRGAHARRTKTLVLGWNKRSVIVCSAIMLLCWLPWLIGLFPGSMNWDTYYQIHQCYPGNHPIYFIPYEPTQSFVDYYFSDHHPVFDTLVFGAFALASDAAFGTWNYGVFLYVAIQSAATALSFTAGVAYLQTMGLGKVGRVILFLVFALFPVYPAYAATMVKDSLFSWIFVVFFIMVVHVVRQGGKPLRNGAFLAGFVAICILLCLTKKPGVYIVLGTLVVLLAAYRRYAWKQLLATCLSCALLMWVILPFVAFPLLDVVPGGKQEALAVPFQQTARYAVDHGDEAQEWEREAIDSVLVYDTLPERYDPDDADPVKFMWNYHCTSDDLLRYFEAWGSQGLRHPEAYAAAWFDMVDGFLIPTDIIQIHRSTGSTAPDESPLIWQPTQLDDLRNGLFAFYDTLAGLPVIGLLFQTCVWATYIPIACGAIIVVRNRKLLPALVPVMLSLLVCFVAPVVHARYALPLIYLDPLLIALALGIPRQRLWEF